MKQTTIIIQTGAGFGPINVSTYIHEHKLWRVTFGQSEEKAAANTLFCLLR